MTSKLSELNTALTAAASVAFLKTLSAKAVSWLELKNYAVTVKMSGCDVVFDHCELANESVVYITEPRSGCRTIISNLDVDNFELDMIPSKLSEMRGTVGATVPDCSRSEYAKMIAAQIAEHHEHRDHPKLKHSVVSRAADDLVRLDVNTLHAIYAALNTAPVTPEAA